MQLSIRLSAIASFVPKGSYVIDVGTDHAYIPIYLVEQGIAKACLATDINKGPLEKARKNLAFHGIQNVSLRQTNGLEGIEIGTGDVVMISGMGGVSYYRNSEKKFTPCSNYEEAYLATTARYFRGKKISSSYWL